VKFFTVPWWFNLILGNAGTDMPKGGTDKTDKSPLFHIAVIHEVRGNVRRVPKAVIVALQT
jgi:hypothetical protein